MWMISVYFGVITCFSRHCFLFLKKIHIFSYIFIIFPFFGQPVRRRRAAPGAGGFMAQLLAELRGAAEAAEVPLQALCSLSLQYEATTLVVYREDLLYK